MTETTCNESATTNFGDRVTLSEEAHNTVGGGASPITGPDGTFGYRGGYWAEYGESQTVRLDGLTYEQRQTLGGSVGGAFTYGPNGSELSPPGFAASIGQGASLHYPDGSGLSFDGRLNFSYGPPSAHFSTDSSYDPQRDLVTLGVDAGATGAIGADGRLEFTVPGDDMREFAQRMNDNPFAPIDALGAFVGW